MLDARVASFFDSDGNHSQTRVGFCVEENHERGPTDGGRGEEDPHHARTPVLGRGQTLSTSGFADAAAA